MFSAKWCCEFCGDIDHEHRKVDDIVYGCLFDVHKVPEPPILFCVSEVELDLKSEGIKVNDFLGTSGQVIAE